jgi:hypothetical protein
VPAIWCFEFSAISFLHSLDQNTSSLIDVSYKDFGARRDRFFKILPTVFLLRSVVCTHGRKYYRDLCRYFAGSTAGVIAESRRVNIFIKINYSIRLGQNQAVTQLDNQFMFEIWRATQAFAKNNHTTDAMA